MYAYAALLKEDSVPRWILIMDVEKLADYMRNPNYSLKCVEENAVNCEVQFAEIVVIIILQRIIVIKIGSRQGDVFAFFKIFQIVVLW